MSKIDSTVRQRLQWLWLGGFAAIALLWMGATWGLPFAIKTVQSYVPPAPTPTPRPELQQAAQLSTRENLPEEMKDRYSVGDQVVILRAPEPIDWLALGDSVDFVLVERATSVLSPTAERQVAGQMPEPVAGSKIIGRLKSCLVLKMFSAQGGFIPILVAVPGKDNAQLLNAATDRTAAIPVYIITQPTPTSPASLASTPTPRT